MCRSGFFLYCDIILICNHNLFIYNHIYLLLGSSEYLCVKQRCFSVCLVLVMSITKSTLRYRANVQVVLWKAACNEKLDCHVQIPVTFTYTQIPLGIHACHICFYQHTLSQHGRVMAHSSQCINKWWLNIRLSYTCIHFQTSPMTSSCTEESSLKVILGWDRDMNFDQQCLILVFNYLSIETK